MTFLVGVISELVDEYISGGVNFGCKCLWFCEGEINDGMYVFVRVVCIDVVFSHGRLGRMYVWLESRNVGLSGDCRAGVECNCELDG